MTARRALGIEQLVPGGIKPTDHWHSITNDNTCSRCSSVIRDHEVPLLLWSNDGHDLLIYCETCLGVTPQPPLEDDEIPNGGESHD